jgi:hypothetical protein
MNMVCSNGTERTGTAHNYPVRPVGEVKLKDGESMLLRETSMVEGLCAYGCPGGEATDGLNIADIEGTDDTCRVPCFNSSYKLLCDCQNGTGLGGARTKSMSAGDSFASESALLPATASPMGTGASGNTCLPSCSI